ncbi:ABC transporter permease subunit [Cryobacterium suzukii]|uniref:ABC transporter permease subunit n=1 Tax=Cryobacterium suzukii TaxID=1259198 RepID=A0A4R9AGR7_9MICO|nr:ABC transporter permease subunit [Cryobacterium suzukii]TFD61648.1 ABC transporter permease subunit [Cryobacterium suzukii]
MVQMRQSTSAARGIRVVTPGLSWALIILVALYIAVPMICALAFSIYVPTTGFTFEPYLESVRDPGFFGALSLTLLITVLTVVGLLAIMVPTMVYLHLKAPRWRPVMEIVCTIPLVVPSIALAAGLVTVLRSMASFGRGSVPAQISQLLQNPDLPIVLVGSYIVLTLPFVFRSLDAGLRTIDLRTLVESAHSLGASGATVLRRVILPNIKGPVIFCTFFCIALCLGEFTMAVTLGYRTLPVWLTQIAGSNFRASISMSLLINALTWALLIAMTVLAGRAAPARALALKGHES